MQYFKIISKFRCQNNNITNKPVKQSCKYYKFSSRWLHYGFHIISHLRRLVWTNNDFTNVLAFMHSCHCRCNLYRHHHIHRYTRDAADRWDWDWKGITSQIDGQRKQQKWISINQSSYLYCGTIIHRQEHDSEVQHKFCTFSVSQN